MSSTRTQFRKNIRLGFTVFFALLIAGYGLWRSLSYARGPHIDIFEPSNGASIASSTTTIAGQGERVTGVTINGSPISFDESGRFSDTLVIFPGVNSITIEGTDQFHRTTETHIQVFGTMTIPGAIPASVSHTDTTASSAPSTSNNSNTASAATPASNSASSTSAPAH